MKSSIPYFLFFGIFVLLLLSSCSRDLDANMPKVQTNGVISITESSFECGGTVISDGGFDITSRGICWSATAEPTAVEGFKTLDGVGIGTFRSKVNNLLPETRYYYRAYATNSEGTAYGEELNFVTKKIVYGPSISTNLVSSIDLITAECGGRITGDGGNPIVLCGICWDTNPNPTTSSTTKVVLTYTSDNFTCTIANLNHSTTYYVRAFAINTSGVAYGENQIFTTIVLPAFDMVSVVGGTFQMGSDNGRSDEKPVHEVTLNAFKIGKVEVTQELWNAVMNGGQSIPGKEKFPINYISMNDAAEFLNKLSLAAKKNYRLPTEAEWEYAAGEGSSSRSFYAAGVNDTVDFISRAWYVFNSNDDIHPVEQLLPNKLGIYDMGGNVSEWCYDWYGDYSSATVSNPKGPANGFNKVLRGGSFMDAAIGCRTSIRHNMDPTSSNKTIGLRIALNE